MASTVPLRTTVLRRLGRADVQPDILGLRCHAGRTVRTVRPQLRRDVLQAGSSNGPTESTTGDLNYDKVLLAISDANPYLSEGSRQALATTAGLAAIHRSKVMVLVVDPPGEKSTDMRFEALSNEMQCRGCQDFELLSRELDTKCSVVVGEVADEIDADLVVMSSDSVHKKVVDANLLAEFVPCPVLLVP